MLQEQGYPEGLLPTGKTGTGEVHEELWFMERTQAEGGKSVRTKEQ